MSEPSDETRRAALRGHRGRSGVAGSPFNACFRAFWHVGGRKETLGSSGPCIRRKPPCLLLVSLQTLLPRSHSFFERPWDALESTEAQTPQGPRLLGDTPGCFEIAVKRRPRYLGPIRDSIPPPICDPPSRCGSVRLLKWLLTCTGT